MSVDKFRALTVTARADAVERAVVELSLADLPSDGALIEVSYSSVNYKDGLATTRDGKVARISPLIPGIDLAGTVVTGEGDLVAGTKVLAHGYDLGVGRHGGFSRYARVPPEWVVELPADLNEREAMTIGTAGFTAAASIDDLEKHGLAPDAGRVLVTGATGGVGSMAVAMLAGKGYEVVASTGKPAATGFLKDLGAAEVISRDELSGEGKPLQSTRWAAAVDCVGGPTLANVLAQVEYGGAVAASGLTGGVALHSTVMPFILRGVALLGVDSVQMAMPRRKEIWSRLAGDLKPASLAALGREVDLEGLPDVLDTILAGRMQGRVVVGLAD